MIFEDDFMFTHPPEIVEEFIRKASTIPFDIMMLGSNTFAERPTQWSFLTKIFSAQTCPAYWISREFAVELLQCFQIATNSQSTYIKRFNTGTHHFAIDQAWKDLQPQYRWYCFSPKLGCQRESYSDIEKKIVNYGI
jgi:hypothetical protein